MATKPDDEKIRVNVSSSSRLKKALGKLSKKHHTAVGSLFKKAIPLIESLTWSEGYEHRGLNFEKLKTSPENHPIYWSLRLSKNWRLLWFRAGNEMVVDSIYTDHDRAYRQ